MDGSAIRDRDGFLGNVEVDYPGRYAVIKDWQEYAELEELCDEADDRIKSGAWASGIHFDLMHILGKHGIYGGGREDAVKKMRKLLSDFRNSQVAPDNSRYEKMAEAQ